MGAAALLLVGLVGCEPPGCPEGMRLVPAGDAVLGVETPTRPWHVARRRIRLPAFCMDRWEHPNRAGEPPTVNVSWPEARALCEAQGRRLCTSDEWERACRGSEGRLHPYGDRRDRAACNTPIEGAGPDPAVGIPFARAGDHPRCVSTEGIEDLDGNVSEWVEDAWTGPRQNWHGAGPAPDDGRTLRGGTMWDATFYGSDCTSAHGHPSSNRGPDDGLRCCADPR